MRVYLERTGRWPVPKSGPVPESPAYTGLAVELALRGGYRGLKGSSSLRALRVELAAKSNRRG
jgi:hypothetical protein